VDIRGLVAEGERDAEPWEVIPAGTRVGHIHLQVGDIKEAKRFYHTILGFDVTADLSEHGALFVSAGGYHHHIGLNTWHSRGAKPTPENAAGLQTYIIAIPSREGLQEVKERLIAHQVPCVEQEDLIRVNHLCWSKQYESELATSYRLVALDLRGHGMSEAPREASAYQNPQLWADDIAAILKELLLERPILVGWSYGGFIICDYIRAYGQE